ncbi:MAG: dehydratase [Betaproteobacteria bacterium]|nr:dehydratase [Betaproteobacteria bacterium]
MTQSPRDLYYFDDFSAGQAFDCGARSVTREQIIAFAREFDPQSFHVDEGAAKRSSFGGLVGSGVHTWGIAQRLAVDGLLGRSACLASPGYERMRFLKPLVPDDLLRLRITVESAVASASRPNMGKVMMLYELFDRAGDLMLDAHAMIFFRRRAAAVGA